MDPLGLTAEICPKLCRRADLLGSTEIRAYLSDARPLEEKWKLWASLESRKRLGISIFVIDTIFPAFLSVPAYHSHRDMFATALPCDESYFLAPSARSWAAHLGMSPIPPSPYFNVV